MTSAEIMRIEREIEPGIIASLEPPTPPHTCCWRLRITKEGQIIESGIWCPNSTAIVINGHVVGFSDSKESVLKLLPQCK